MTKTEVNYIQKQAKKAELTRKLVYRGVAYDIKKVIR